MKGQWTSQSQILLESKLTFKIIVRFKNIVIDTSGPLIFVFIAYFWLLEFFRWHKLGY